MQPSLISRLLLSLVILASAWLLITVLPTVQAEGGASSAFVSER